LHLPAEQRKIGGLGVYLALGSVDRFCYERVGDRNRNVLVMNRRPPD
jgi:anti-sigma regulatory factor (Ser/Thr protein kinase)